MRKSILISEQSHLSASIAAILQKNYGAKVINISNEHYHIRNEGTKDVVMDMFLWDEIDEWWGINSKMILKDLKDTKPNIINMFVSGMGGDVQNALQIKQLVKGHKAIVNVYWSGFVASAHTIISLAGDPDKIFATSDTMGLIHNVLGVSYGNKDDHNKAAVTQGMVDEMLVSGYVAKTGKSREEIVDQMKKGDDDEWMDVDALIEFGLVDGKVESLPLAASVKPFEKTYTLDDFSSVKIHAPKNFKQKGQTMKNQISILIAGVIASLVKDNKDRKSEDYLQDIADELSIPLTNVQDIVDVETETVPDDDQFEVIAEVLDCEISAINPKAKSKPEAKGTELKDAISAGFADLVAKLTEAGVITAKKDIDVSAIITEAVGKIDLSNVKNDTSDLDELKKTVKELQDNEASLKEDIKNIKGAGSAGVTSGGDNPFAIENLEELDDEVSDKALANTIDNYYQNND